MSRSARPHARTLSLHSALGVALAAWALVSCGSGDDRFDRARVPEGFPKAECDALDPSHCALPWPSSLYLERTDATPTGYALRFGAESLSKNSSGRALDPALFDGLDGYGLGVPIVVGLGDVDLSGLPNEWDGIASSVDPGSRSL